MMVEAVLGTVQIQPSLHQPLDVLPSNPEEGVGKPQTTEGDRDELGGIIALQDPIIRQLPDLQADRYRGEGNPLSVDFIRLCICGPPNLESVRSHNELPLPLVYGGVFEEDSLHLPIQESVAGWKG